MQKSYPKHKLTDRSDIYINEIISTAYSWYYCGKGQLHIMSNFIFYYKVFYTPLSENESTNGNLTYPWICDIQFFRPKIVTAVIEPIPTDITICSQR